MSTWLTYRDFETVAFHGEVLRATYGAEGHPENDVTAAVRGLRMPDGRTEVRGGIHTRIGDPAPGAKKIFRVLLAGNATAEYFDFDNSTFLGEVARATYGPVGTPGNDVTAQVRNLRRPDGSTEMMGGAHLTLGDPAPGVAKIFRVTFAGGQAVSTTQTWLSYRDMETVTFTGDVLRATYGPQGYPPNDVTAAVRGLRMPDGRVEVHGGIHTRIGDPAPGVAKLFLVLITGNASVEYRDFDNVTYKGEVARATYGPVGTPGSDFTMQVRNLKRPDGSTEVMGGIHKAIGDPAPGAAKIFRVTFA